MLNRTKTTRNNPFKRWPLRIKQFSLAHTQGHILPHVFTQKAHYSKFYLICSKEHVHHVCYTNKCVQPHKLQRFSWTTSNSHKTLWFASFTSCSCPVRHDAQKVTFLTLTSHSKKNVHDLCSMLKVRFTSHSCKMKGLLVLPPMFMCYHTHTKGLYLFTSYTSLQ